MVICPCFNIHSLIIKACVKALYKLCESTRHKVTWRSTEYLHIYTTHKLFLIKSYLILLLFGYAQDVPVALKAHTFLIKFMQHISKCGECIQ